MRPVVSYDDITLPYEAGPAAKKRKNNYKKAKAVTTTASDEESRELSHNEIWDDSALIDAWNSAKAEYAEYHDDPDGWKTQSVKKSPLWYNKPPDASKLSASKHDSKPIDFDTFVPSHDASLDLPVPTMPSGVPGPGYASQFLPNPHGPMVSADEAFSHALGAMYWGGYWTAMYHCQRQKEAEAEYGRADALEDIVVEDAGDEEDAEDDGEELLSTQR